MQQKQSKLYWTIIFCFFFLIGAPRFFSLDAHWASDEALWLRRSAQFMSAVKKGEFSDTLIAYHPGVTTMWIAGFRTFFMQPHLNLENLARARWFIGIMVWIGIGIACLLLYRLFGLWVALPCLVSLAYSPLFLAQTRRVHTDALATTFILLTVLLFLIYCRNQRHRRYLVFSGVTFGLALLSKSYALILLPWVPLCLFLFREKRSGGFLTYIAEILCFLNCSVLTVLSLWPVFWTPTWGLLTLCFFSLTLLLLKGIKNERCSVVLMIVVFAGLILICTRATQTVWHVFDRVHWAVTTAHEVEHFFLGKVVNDPGWLFFPFVLTIKSTPLMLPLSFFACLLLWKKRKHSEEAARQWRLVLALVAGVVLFTFSLSATSKKLSRYLLPAFPMLEILSAIGLVEGIKWCYAVLRPRFGTAENNRYKEAFATIAGISFFLLQVFPVLTLHPYYGTYYNLCWKVTDITQITTVGDASGLDLAAKYLNQKANARQLRVTVSPLARGVFQYYFAGFAYKPGRTYLPVDYEVVYIRDAQVGKIPQSGKHNGKIEHTIPLNGIDHVWIYRIEKL